MATILHVDMDAFYASVELLHHPEWRGKPLVVGAGPHERGVVSTCSYEARRFGIHSAMPSRTAFQRCPHAIFTPPHMDLYEEMSARAFAIFSRYSPYVEGVSVDEAFLDITGTIHLHGSATRLGEHLRAAIKGELGLTCSVGIAPNRLLSKIGSELHKPDGLTMMPFREDEIAAFLATKPIGLLWGVGGRTERMLAPYGIRTCGDIQRADESALATILGSRAAAIALKEHAMGRSSDVVAREDESEKSVSREYTFDIDVSSRGTVRARLVSLASEVGRRFRSEERWARTARLKIRDADFNTHTRQAAFPRPSRDDFALRKAALALFDAEWPPGRPYRSIRLVGFGVANIQTTPPEPEMSLFADDQAKTQSRREKLSEAMDTLRDKGYSVDSCGLTQPPTDGRT